VARTFPDSALAFNVHWTYFGIHNTMKVSLLYCALIASFSFSLAMGQEKAADNGYTSLFDGKALTGWKNAYDWGKIAVVDGEVHLTGDKKFFVVTEKSYSDFIFEGDILLPAGKANSGFMFRAHVAPNKVTGYQAEVDGDETRKWSGGLYDEGRRMWFVSPIKGDQASVDAFRARAGDAFKRNDWNTYRITCKGSKIKIEVNGVVTSEFEDAMDAAGPIAIQHHGEAGQTYKFRNLRIKELK